MPSPQGTPVQVPVAAEFADFSVEATYSDATTRTVTTESTLTPRSPTWRQDGGLVGVRPGKTSVKAVFAGVASEQSLAVEVTERHRWGARRGCCCVRKHLRRPPSAIRRQVGRRHHRPRRRRLAVEQARDRPSQRPDVRHRRLLGQSSITAKFGSIAQRQRRKIDVVAAPWPSRWPSSPRRSGFASAERPPLAPTSRIHAGSGRRDPGLRGRGRYVPETRSLVGVSPGQSVGSDGSR